MEKQKSGIRHLVEICFQKGIENIVISPGSRNAPIIIAFTNHPKINCLSIVDERSAAFFALGMAQQSGKTVAIACTSGSAALNYAPAIAEAYYQHIPLLVLTADRPKEWIDQADSQTIRQNGIYSNYIKKSFELPQSIQNDDDLWYTDRLINEAIDLCQSSTPGPVHINLPFKEPLYQGYDEEIAPPKLINTAKITSILEEHEIKRLANHWNTSSKKLIISGMMNPNPELNNVLIEISKDPSVVFLTENTSNLHYSAFNSCIDRTLAAITEEELENFKPDLLISFGNQIVSKKIKAYFRQNQPDEHWHIDTDELFLDTYQSLTKNIPVEPASFFNKMSGHIIPYKSNFSIIWDDKSKLTTKKHQEFIEKCEYSDLKVFDLLLKAIPSNSNLQLANSTPIRYTQLFDARLDLVYNSNRGTSGIDGSLSTAVGAAYETKDPTTIILGDLSFFYDSNGLWNDYLSNDLRIILINNGGGGIFRFLDGPSDTKDFETYFETTHRLNAEGIAKTFNIQYQSASNFEEVKAGLSSLYHPENKKVSLLEIFTPREVNAIILKDYFRFLKKG
ncbi:MAG: 2-succinyl-5-enolpyruvyl-6-hydroxy-3-cyclohexene-1-carboxylic-acid synthase [Bacteroidetes bacterium HGW-Bacteroidetes-17]|jgi:2-succinyl-5-enolpyruvyl-6-hydroxy-3-cyclohexene-1-carboxylate synthase|nr:MAG: 2-succinyl-5-enolpyruvyl-6-hydroxy-3-cyclohexene-1-carboxylic-acid synthase [Bacteroidetes bacterium HGW-Bacteroidetes-17]